MVRLRRWAKLLTLVSFLVTAPPAHAQLMKTLISLPVMTWTGTGSGSQTFVAGTTIAPFSTGTYTVTVSRPMTVLVKGVASGGSGGAMGVSGDGGQTGGGGGAADTVGESVTLLPGVAYTITFSSNIKFEKSGTVYLELTAGTQGGPGGTVLTGANGVAGGAGGAPTLNGGNGGATQAAGGGGGGKGDGGTGPGAGGTGSGLTAASSGPDGQDGGGHTHGLGATGGQGVAISGVAGVYGGGAGGSGENWAGSAIGIAGGQAAVIAFTFVSAP